MVSISATSQLIAIIRQQVVAGAAHAVQIRPTTSSSPARTDTRHGHNRTLAEMLSQRIRAIDPDDPRRNHKAFRAFLESVLLGELGVQLINDPAFYSIVTEVHSTMESDPTLAAKIDEAGKLLFSSQFKR